MSARVPVNVVHLYAATAPRCPPCSRVGSEPRRQLMELAELPVLRIPDRGGGRTVLSKDYVWMRRCAELNWPYRVALSAQSQAASPANEKPCRRKLGDGTRGPGECKPGDPHAYREWDYLNPGAKDRPEAETAVRIHVASIRSAGASRLRSLVDASFFDGGRMELGKAYNVCSCSAAYCGSSGALIARARCVVRRMDFGAAEAEKASFTLLPIRQEERPTRQPESFGSIGLFTGQAHRNLKAVESLLAYL